MSNENENVLGNDPWAEEEVSLPKAKAKTKVKTDVKVEDPTPTFSEVTAEGLRLDAKNTTELENLVYSLTNGMLSLNLLGIGEKAYELALDALQGRPVPDAIIRKKPLFQDRVGKHIVPKLKHVLASDFPRSPDLPDETPIYSFQSTGHIEHPDQELRAKGQKVTIEFRKYSDDSLTYQVVSSPFPVTQISGQLDEDGNRIRHVVDWIDPRGSEKYVRKGATGYTNIGRALKLKLSGVPLLNCSVWDYVDRPIETMSSTSSADISLDEYEL